MIRLFRHFLRLIDTSTDFIGRITGWLVLPLIGLTVYEIITRYFLNMPTLWTHETTQMTFGVYAILLGGYCLLHAKHVRVDIIWNRLSLRGKALADLITSVFGFIFLGFLFYYSIQWGWHSLQIQECSISAWSPPIYPAKLFIIIGSFLFLIQFITKTMRDIYTVITEHKVVLEND